MTMPGAPGAPINLPVNLVPWHEANPLESFRMAARACWAHEYGDMFSPVPLAVHFFLRGLSPHTRHRLAPFEYLVAMRGGKAVGLVGLYTSEERPREGWVGWCPTHPAAGALDDGPAILRAVVTRAKERAFPLHVLRLWTSAHPAYQNVNAFLEQQSFEGEKFVSHPLPFLEPQLDAQGRRMERTGYLLSLHSLYLQKTLKPAEGEWFPWQQIPFRTLGPHWIKWGFEAFRNRVLGS